MLNICSTWNTLHKRKHLTKVGLVVGLALALAKENTFNMFSIEHHSQENRACGRSCSCRTCVQHGTLYTREYIQLGPRMEHSIFCNVSMLHCRIRYFERSCSSCRTFVNHGTIDWGQSCDIVIVLNILRYYLHPLQQNNH